MSRIKEYISAPFYPVDNYRLASGLFLKALAVIYFAAFLSLAVQVTGLVGANGILPFHEVLEYMYQSQGASAYLYKPTVFWIDSSDTALVTVCVLGCAVSLLLLAGIQPTWSLIVLFVLYLSLLHAGQTFLMFQWDILLLEAGFLAIFLTRGANHLLLFMFHWLLFRLRFMSGVSKLASGDPSWSGMTTLNYYFETQPLPHIGAWYFHQLPDWVLKGGVMLVLFSELVVPFFIFLPRKFRLFAAGFTIVIQLLIIATSNHNWINLMTIVLCLFLLDDDLLRKILPGSVQRYTALEPALESASHGGHKLLRNRFLLPVFAFLIMLSSVVAFTSMVTNSRLADSLKQSTVLIRLWGIGHIYHVFPNMQVERHELEIEGSDDGVEWKAYVFKYKPGPLDEMPAFIVPHQPRLDWMIWFVPPRSERMMYWFGEFMQRIHEGSPEVLGLLRHNPFPDKPPRYLRVKAYQYWFTSEEEREATGNWWRREHLGQFPYVRPRIP